VLQGSEFVLHWEPQIAVDISIGSFSLFCHQVILKFWSHFQTYVNKIPTGICIVVIHCVQKNNTDVRCYSFNVSQPICIIFGRNVAKRPSCQMILWFHLTDVFALPGERWTPKNCDFLLKHYCFVNKHTKQLKTHSNYHVVTAESLLIHKTVDCIHQTKTMKRA